MITLSTKKGYPIAKIVGNKDYKSINCYLPDEDKQDFKSIYAKNKAIQDSDKFTIENGSLEPTVNFRQQRDVLYIAGPSGAGKSTYASKYIKNYLTIYPDHEVYIFSKVSEDEAFDKYPITRIPINEETFMEEQLSLDDFNDCLVIFDDIDTIPDKNLCWVVCNLRDQILEMGRHNRVSCVITSHQIMNYKATRTSINESHTVTFFPRGGAVKQIKSFLNTYIGLDNKKITKVLETRSRWVTVSKTYPTYLFYEKGAELLQ